MSRRTSASTVLGVRRKGSSRTNGRLAPAATGISRAKNSTTRSAFSVVSTTGWFPSTVVIPSTSTSGLASASMIAITSS
jgi:hypothetical protein